MDVGGLSLAAGRVVDPSERCRAEYEGQIGEGETVVGEVGRDCRVSIVTSTGIRVLDGGYLGCALPYSNSLVERLCHGKGEQPRLI